MHFLKSNLVGREGSLATIHEQFKPLNFFLGGEWDYEHGFFDKVLDELGEVFLRIPFKVTHGEFDADSNQLGILIRIGEPFVLHHQFQRGQDQSAKIRVVGALLDQFQAPVDADAPIDSTYIQKAEGILVQLSNLF